jgi:hypothetical protein
VEPNILMYKRVKLKKTFFFLMGELSPLNLIAGSAFGHIDSLTISDSTIYGWLKNPF